MKKKYIKPEILFEDFTMSTSVASCETSSMQKVYNDSQQCGFYDEYLKVVIISSSVEGCATSKVKGYRAATTPGENDQVCYHVPVEAYRMFNS